jgi:hypothetical protein
MRSQSSSTYRGVYAPLFRGSSSPRRSIHRTAPDQTLGFRSSLVSTFGSCVALRSKGSAKAFLYARTGPGR